MSLQPISLNLPMDKSRGFQSVVLVRTLTGSNIYSCSRIECKSQASARAFPQTQTYVAPALAAIARLDIGTYSASSRSSVSNIVEIDLTGNTYSYNQLALLLEPDENGRSYIHELVENGSSAELLNLYQAMKNEYSKDEIKQFFDKKEHGTGHSPLHKAVLKNNKIIAGELIAYGASVNIQDANGRTPLYYTTLQYNADFVSMFCKFGADPRIEDTLSLSPLNYVIASGSLDAFKLITYRLSHDQLQRYRGTNGMSLLHIAACYDNKDILTYLIQERTLSLTALDNNNYMPIHHAIRQKHFQSIYHLTSKETCEQDSQSRATEIMRCAIRSKDTALIFTLLVRGYPLPA